MIAYFEIRSGHEEELEALDAAEEGCDLDEILSDTQDQGMGGM
jgi:hypothetical protein